MSRLKKKKRVVGHSDLEKESDFVEDLVRDYKKKSENKGKIIKDSPMVRASSPSDDETLSHRLERKRYPSRCLEKKFGYKGDLGEEDPQKQGIYPDYGEKYEGTLGTIKGMHGNHGVILKEIGVMKNQMQILGSNMQALRKEVGHARKIARGECTLG